MKRLIPKLMLMLMSICIFHLSSFAQSNDQISNDLIAMVKAEWAADIANASMADQMKSYADDYTEFSNDYATRVDGKSLNMTIGEANAKGKTHRVAAQMLNPKVQVYGDCAILTYNYAGVIQDATGDTQAARAKSTRVFVKQGGKWMMVHANFAPDPVPGQ
jgi:ketosteroid isomerase-like protein